MSETANPSREQPMWIKSNFRFDSHSRLLYYRNNGEEKFVARFKYRRSPFGLGVFKKELLKNHTPASYFSSLEKVTPINILATKNPQWYEKTIGLPFNPRHTCTDN